MKVKVNYDTIDDMKEWQKDRLLKLLLNNTEDLEIDKDNDITYSLNLQMIGLLTIETLKLEGIIEY